MPDASPIARNLADIRERIDAAARRAGRDPASVTLLPVSKTFGEDAIREAIAAGYRRFGENKVQEIRDKQTVMADANVRWVVIGHLQTNKAKDVARLATEVQSLDRLDLALALEKRLQIEGRTLDVLVQVKTATEPSKFGCEPAEVAGLLRDIVQQAPSLKVKGLMTMATNTDDPAAVRACFRALRELRNQLREQAIPGIELDRLSMGMSGDFEIAIEEGSTEVRVGSAIFGQRHYAA